MARPSRLPPRAVRVRSGPARAVLTTVALAVAIVAALVVERALLSWVPGATPDLVAVLVVCAAVARGPRTGAGWGLLAGVLADLAPPSTGVVGAWALAYVLCGAGAGVVGTGSAQTESGRPTGGRPGRRDPARWRSRRRISWLAGAAAVLAALMHLGVLALVGDSSVPGASPLAGTFVLGFVYAAVLGWCIGPALVRLLRHL